MYLKVCFVAIFLMFFNTSRGAVRVDPLVDTKVGLIRGLKAEDGDYSMFLGIPYADVDKNNPFGPSTPHQKFDTVFDAVHDSVICPQILDNGTAVGIIDCLQLNVYVPRSASSDNKVPVLVYFYGGSFYRGYANRDLYGPRFLVKHDVILVTVNYRVGAYGFMCLDTPDVPGNQGLKDLLIALRWLKNNIESFGGNANKITLFGQSAGGRAVDFHLISEQEKLFDKVIIQSGISISPPVIGEVDTRAPRMLAEKIGFIPDNVPEALSFLATADPLIVVAAASEIDYTFRPCVENDFDNVEKFVTDYTNNKNMPKVKTTPILTGYTDNELFLAHAGKDNAYFENLNIFEDTLKSYFDFDEERLKEMVNLVKQFYIGDEKMSNDNMQSIADFHSDFTYLHPIHRRTYQNILNGAQTIYHYLFSYNGRRNMSFQRNVTMNGAGHGDDIGYLFQTRNLMDDEITAEDQIMIDRMTTLWTNFAKYGDPTPNVTDLLPIKWKPITEEKLYYYKIDSEVSLESRPFKKRMAFWDLFFKYNRQLQKGYQRS